MESENGSENEGNIPSGKRLHNYWKSAFWMGKSTISTGPWLQVRKLSQSLPGRVMFLNLVHHFPNIQVPFRVVQICQDSTVFWPPAEEGVCGGVQPVGRAAVQLQTTSATAFGPPRCWSPRPHFFVVQKARSAPVRGGIIFSPDTTVLVGSCVENRTKLVTS